MFYVMRSGLRYQTFHELLFAITKTNQFDSFWVVLYDHLNLPHEGGGVGQSVDQWLGVVSMTHKQTEGPVNGQLVPLTVALSRNGIPFNTSTCILQSVKSGLSHIFKYHLWTVMKTNAFACDLKEDTYSWNFRNLIPDGIQNSICC